MSKKNRSVSDEELENVRGGIIYVIERYKRGPLYAVLDDKYDLVDVKEDISSAYNLAEDCKVKDQRVITLDTSSDYIREQLALAVMKKFGQKKND